MFIIDTISYTCQSEKSVRVIRNFFSEAIILCGKVIIKVCNYNRQIQNLISHVI
jgi:hypothetical protein